jgi:hypothetical protein
MNGIFIAGDFDIQCAISKYAPEIITIKVHPLLFNYIVIFPQNQRSPDAIHSLDFLSKEKRR